MVSKKQEINFRKSRFSNNEHLMSADLWVTIFSNNYSLKNTAVCHFAALLATIHSTSVMQEILLYCHSTIILNALSKRLVQNARVVCSVCSVAKLLAVKTHQFTGLQCNFISHISLSHLNFSHFAPYLV